MALVQASSSLHPGPPGVVKKGAGSTTDKEKAAVVSRSAAVEGARERQIVAKYVAAVAAGEWSELKIPEVTAEALAKAGALLSLSKSPLLSLFWANYDIEESLAPRLVKPREFAAARRLARFFQTLAARRKRGRKEREKRRFVQQREALKIQTRYRSYVAVCRYKAIVQERKDDEEESAKYANFLAGLLDGVRTLRWSHSKKALVPCEVRVGDDYQHFVFQQNAVKLKRYFFHDLQAVTKGHASPFLTQYVLPRDSDKTLSIFFRDRRKQGKEVTVDLVFDAAKLQSGHRRRRGGLFSSSSGSAASGSAASSGKKSNVVKVVEKKDQDPAGGAGGGAASGGGTAEKDSSAKKDRDRFYQNMLRLIRELESDDAFFFTTTGSYCRVGRSIFERWERVTMIDPDFAGSRWVGKNKATPRLLLAGGAPASGADEASLVASKKPRRIRGCFHPLPITHERDKPQNRPDDVEILYKYKGKSRRDNSIKQLGAAWHSRTETIDYTDHVLEQHRHFFFEADRFVDGDKETLYMQKEVFTLQRYKLNQAKGEWQPQYASKKKPLVGGSAAPAGSGGSGGSGSSKKEVDDARAPTRVRLLELKPHFAAMVKKMYGVMGITGWRNTVTSEFDFEDAAWRKVIAFARQRYAKDATTLKCARDLEAAMDTADELNAGVESPKQDPTAATTTATTATEFRSRGLLARALGGRRKRSKVENEEKKAEARRASRAASVQSLVKCRMDLMRRIWSANDQVEGTMWDVVGEETFNTAQKLSVTKDQKELEARARAEERKERLARAKQRRSSMASSRRQSSFAPLNFAAADNGPGSSHASASPLPAADTNLSSMLPPGVSSGAAAAAAADDPPFSAVPRMIDDVKELPGTRVEVRVNEVDSKHPLPLGLVVEPYYDPELFTVPARKRVHKLKTHHALKVVNTKDPVPPSVDAAYQNLVVGRGDLLVAVNGRTADSKDDLVNLTQHAYHARVLTFFRVDANVRLADDPPTDGDDDDDDDDDGANRPYRGRRHRRRRRPADHPERRPFVI